MTITTTENRCRHCAAEGTTDTTAVTVEERTGLASCMEGLHNHAWFVHGPHAEGAERGTETSRSRPTLAPVPDDEPFPLGPLNGGGRR